MIGIFETLRRTIRWRDRFQCVETNQLLLPSCSIGWDGNLHSTNQCTAGTVSIAKPARKEEKTQKPVHSRPEDEKERLECYEDDDDENLLFTNYMKAMEVPTNFKMPLMDKYNERGDPTDHINIYKTKLQGHFPVVKCRNFHTTLTSDTNRWYNKLKPKSIRSWPQLKREFVNAFIGNRTMVAYIVQLHNIRQKEGETVKSYFKRFNNVINKIKIVTNDKVLDALVTGLHMRTPF
ncbi:Retrotrans gag domain-containing protein [Abeliophyllum distichum]|uniref:Retrotrans gag domain-containing protein n=1 Tax=Abeliophyllum distichum TaxID=126358 RepID=A0ABD1W2L2_9LAMI